MRTEMSVQLCRITAVSGYAAGLFGRLARGSRREAGGNFGESFYQAKVATARF